MDKPRQRRLVTCLSIALALAAIITCIDRCCSRNVDQRLVGTWAVTTPTPGRAGQVYRFGRYGRADVSDQSRIVGCRFSWKVSGTTVEFCRFNNRQAFGTWISRECEFLWRRLTTGKLPDDDVAEHYEIVEWRPDEISLMWVEGNHQFTLRRYSE